jgi:hypothetical protein
MAFSSPGRCSIVPDGSFTRDQIIAALSAVGEKLTAQGVHAQMFIVGGAAMALTYSGRRLTKDIDAVFEPKSLVYDAAAEVAREQNLPEDWLNDAVKGLLPGQDDDPRPVPEIAGIEVGTASPPYLLAMKLKATRIGEDDDDIRILLDVCGIRDAATALALLDRMYPQEEMLPKVRFFLEELLGPEA